MGNRGLAAVSLDASYTNRPSACKRRRRFQRPSLTAELGCSCPTFPRLTSRDKSGVVREDGNSQASPFLPTKPALAGKAVVEHEPHILPTGGLVGSF